MNIYAFIPLIAIIAYIPLLVTIINSRPWSRQQRLFLFFLVTASLWSLADIFFESSYFRQYSFSLLKIIIFLFVLMTVQFHCFTSSFFPSGKGRWLPFAYGSLLLAGVLTALGYLPNNVTHDGDKIYVQYGYAVAAVAIPLLILLARNTYVLVPRLRKQENPVVHNQTVSLLLCLGVLTVCMLPSLIIETEIPIGHIGIIIIASILTYAVVKHQLLDIRVVLRAGFVWVIMGIIGIVSYWILLLGAHLLLKFELTQSVMIYTSVSGIISIVIIYKLRGLIIRTMDRAFQGDKYYYREKLLDFVNKIHNVFTLKEQGVLLTLITRSIGCGKAGLLFVDSNDDFGIRLMEPAGENSISSLKLRGDSPIVQYLKRERRPLMTENLSILPDFLGLWQQEREDIENNGLELLIPLISRDRLISILVLDKKRTGRYNLEDYKLLEDVTGRAAVSMEKEYLREQMEEREEELSVINRSNSVITSSLDIQQIYDGFIKELKRIVDVNWAAIAIIEDEELFFLAISTDVGSAWKAGERIPLKGTATEWVTTHRKPIVDPDLSLEMRFTTGKYHIQHSIRSIVYLPLIVSNRVIGTLSVASRNPDAYSSRQLKLLEQLASQIAMPIENARLYAKTERMARIDDLTGLLNRRSLDEMLGSEINRHSRYGGVFSLIMIDMDSLKEINDTYGHLVGDELLRQIGRLIKNTIREADQAFRYGGDEFAVVLPHTPIDAAFNVAERIRQATFSRTEIGSTPVSVSLGLACWPADGLGPNNLIAAADEALYQAKSSGGNCSRTAVVKLAASQKEKSSLSDQDSGTLSIIYALAETVDNRDRLTHNHSKLVRDYSVAIGEGMGMDQLEINRLGTCALLHDIGKIGISDEILNKEDSLTDKEWEIIKSHPALGAAIASHSPQLAPCIQGILHHHEKYNGEGYPGGLKGGEIPVESRILAIADSFAAMTSARIYSNTYSYEGAREEIKKGAGTQFDPDLVDVFLVTVKNTISSLEYDKMGSESK